LFNPMLLVMDEPTEGLAPVIVEQVADMLKRLAGDGEISVLLIEQNLGVAIDVADTIDVMVNGRIARSMPAAELAADRELQQQLLGVTTPPTAGGGEGAVIAPGAFPHRAETDEVRIYTVRRSADAAEPGEAAGASASAPADRAVRGFTRWNAADPLAAPRERLLEGRVENA